MATQKSFNKSIRKLTKVGGLSLSVTLPIEIVREMKCLSRRSRAAGAGEAESNC